MNIFVVIPTIRTLEFLSSWKNQFADTVIIVVEDNATKHVKVPSVPCLDLFHYSHKEIEKDMGERSWIFPWKSAAVRSYGFYKAYQKGADIIITLDDDCYPGDDHFVDTHVRNLSLKIASDWYPTYPFAELMYTRGFPYLVRGNVPVMISHGLWYTIPDLDAVTQLVNYRLQIDAFPPFLSVIPKGYFYPMSAMNLAFRREVTPLMYQLLMGHNKKGIPWGYDRFDDIWSGIFAKKILDHLKLGVVNGAPYVDHKRASDPFANLKKETTGIETNETLWKLVLGVTLTGSDVVSCYRELNNTLLLKEEYFVHLQKAISTWLSLFSNNFQKEIGKARS